MLPENRGHNEKILGEAVREYRRNVVLATKLHIGTDKVTEKGLETVMREHLMASLHRLQTDSIDLYYLHRINPAIPVEEVAEVMGRLITDGMIRGWGLSYPNVVPISGSKNQERILENLGAWNVTLTEEEFTALETALEQIPVHGHRGFVEQEGGSMKEWNRK